MFHEDSRCGRFVLVNRVADQAVSLVVYVGQVDTAKLRLNGFFELLAIGFLTADDKFG